MKKLLLLILLSSIAMAKIVDGIAITIDNEPITLYDIKQERAISNISVKEAVDILIRRKLEAIEAKKRNIHVSNQEILDDLKNMAQENRMSLNELYEAMSSSRNLSESQVKAKVKEKLLKNKLFNAIAISKLQEPSDEDIKEYYNLHIKDYQLPKSVDTILYTSKSREALKKKISSPMMNISACHTKDVTLQMAKINPRFAKLIAKTKINSFTPILPQGEKNEFISFYILKKNDINTPPLDLIYDQVKNSVLENKREQILSEHFQRMRVNAQIKVIRIPKG